MSIHAWHFVGKKLRNGDHIPSDGQWLEWEGPLKMCESGLHASRQLYDALKYAPGETLCLVECGGEVIEQSDKLVCSRRKILARMDATEMLRYFSRMQALSVVHLWDAPDVVLDYLMIGDLRERAAAEAAARAAARAAADAAAWAAAEAAARAAAQDAAWAAARAAAGDAAWAAARAAAQDAAWAAARAAAGDAAWAAAREAAWDAAGDAAWAAAQAEFNALVYECFEGPIEHFKVKVV